MVIFDVIHRLDASRSRAVWRAWHTGFLPFGRTQPGTMASCGGPRLAAICQVCDHDNAHRLALTSITCYDLFLCL